MKDKRCTNCAHFIVCATFKNIQRDYIPKPNVSMRIIYAVIACNCANYEEVKG